ncbi:DUF2946 domain-containing protein [Lysobacter pythonis]|uniref:DUF2946 domain-containing protein n=1 Tax=Solilutibacter pythonis TaxID=2483112 RepID=A0A3M2HKI3_9GAMM|nr:DUF2946 family protein [Lysobacter pythonis]RMH87889.1 DUF2946 domain-containing protein [Lysobacter pythonis]
MHSAFRGQRSISYLALLAASLLALLPTFGRLHQASVISSNRVALCTASGFEYADIRTENGKPSPAGQSGERHGDCEYCPLAASLNLPAAISGWTGDEFPATAVLPFPKPHARLFKHPSGLGSRGPPSNA